MLCKQTSTNQSLFKVNALDSAGQTALHRAARDGNVQACRMLLTGGADPSIVSLQGFTAAQLSTESVSKLLSEEPASSAGTADLEYQLLEAAKAGDLELVKKVVLDHPHIVNCRDLDGRHSTPLHFAAGYNRVSLSEQSYEKPKMAEDFMGQKAILKSFPYLGHLLISYSIPILGGSC